MRSLHVVQTSVGGRGRDHGKARRRDAKNMLTVKKVRRNGHIHTYERASRAPDPLERAIYREPEATHNTHTLHVAVCSLFWKRALGWSERLGV